MFHTEELNNIKGYLTDRQQTIAVAESVTAGLLQTALASAEDASKFFQGGITVYNLGQKCRHLNINPIHAEQCNCVSGKMAEDMAVNVCGLFISDWGIAVTGYATPVPQSHNRRFAYYAVAFQGEIMLSEKLETNEEDALKVQEYYVNSIIDQLAKTLDEASD